MSLARFLDVGQQPLSALPELTDHEFEVLTDSLSTALASKREADGTWLVPSLDGRADLYSVGILLFEMLTGTRPFEGDIQQLLRHHLITDLAPLGLFSGPGSAHREELSEVAAAKIVAEHAERRRGVAEAARGLCRSELFDEVGTQGFVLPLARRCRFVEEVVAFRQANRGLCHSQYMSMIVPSVNRYFAVPRLLSSEVPEFTGLFRD